MYETYNTATQISTINKDAAITLIVISFALAAIAIKIHIQTYRERKLQKEDTRHELEPLKNPKKINDKKQ